MALVAVATAAAATFALRNAQHASTHSLRWGNVFIPALARTFAISAATMGSVSATSATSSSTSASSTSSSSASFSTTAGPSSSIPTKVTNILSSSGKSSLTTDANSSSSSPLVLLPLAFVSESAYIPHPEKKAKGSNGEDAHLVSKYAVAVADGVGGWSEVGVDAGIFARGLLDSVGKYLEDEIGSGIPPTDALKAVEYGVSQMSVQGSSTMTLALAGRDGTLRLCNVGDSGLSIWRYSQPRSLFPVGKLPLEEAKKLWECVYTAPHQTHGFNYPFQLASPPQNPNERSSGDSPDSGIHVAITVQPGDLVIVGSDGLWDNVEEEQIQNILARYDYASCMQLTRMRKVRYVEALKIERELKKKTNKTKNAQVNADGDVSLIAGDSDADLPPDLVIRSGTSYNFTDAQVADTEKACKGQLAGISAMLAATAIRLGNDRTYNSPFAKGAARHGHRFQGGKLDDTAVVVALVVPDDSHFDMFGDAE